MQLRWWLHLCFYDFNDMQIWKKVASGFTKEDCKNIQAGLWVLTEIGMKNLHQQQIGMKSLHQQHTFRIIKLWELVYPLDWREATVMKRSNISETSASRISCQSLWLHAGLRSCVQNGWRWPGQWARCHLCDAAPKHPGCALQRVSFTFWHVHCRGMTVMSKSVKSRRCC